MLSRNFRVFLSTLTFMNSSSSRGGFGMIRSLAVMLRRVLHREKQDVLMLRVRRSMRVIVRVRLRLRERLRLRLILKTESELAEAKAYGARRQEASVRRRSCRDHCPHQLVVNQHPFHRASQLVNRLVCHHANPRCNHRTNLLEYHLSSLQRSHRHVLPPNRPQNHRYSLQFNLLKSRLLYHPLCPQCGHRCNQHLSRRQSRQRSLLIHQR